MELLGALEDRYQVDLSETRFAAVKTVGDLERMLHGKLPPRAPYHYPAWVQRWPTTWVRLAHSLSAFASGGISAGMAAHYRAGKSARASRAGAGGVQSH